MTGRLKNLAKKKLHDVLLFPTVFYPLILIGIEVLIFWTNYTPGTFLIGWDNIMPEFNLQLNFTRSLVSLWQDYRGLGTLDGLSHAANLMHTLVIWLLSFAFPQSMLRYVFIHSMHLLGGIGMFLLLRNLLTETVPHSEVNHEHDPFKHRFWTSRNDTIAFLGAIFYMGNLGIIQLFYAPLEVFATHFAALPLIIWQLEKTIRHGTPRNLFLLFLLSFLLSPQGFVPTVFFVFLLLIGCLLLFYLLTTKNLRRTLLLGVIILAGNAFWLLPYSYSALFTPAVIKETKINQIASEEIFYRNKAYGDLLSIFSFKGFMISTNEFDVKADQDVYFMQRWLDHVSSVPYRLLFFDLFVMMLLGVVLTIKQKHKQRLPFLLAFFLSFLFLANNTPGFEQFTTTLRTFFPILGEALRFPFTKFMTLFVFCFTLFFTIGLAYLSKRFTEHKRELFLFVFASLVYLSFPIFQGYFTSPLLRLNFPSDYLQLFAYFKDKDPNERIATLPMHTFWNWQYRSWNHRGSGFLWYGLPQPLLERAFDPWSLTNEQYYNELSSAINREDPVAVRHILSKYTISSILLDETLLNTLSRQPINFTQLKSFLETEVGLRIEAQFGKLTIYHTSSRSAMLSALPVEDVTAVHTNTFTGRSIGLETLTPTYITTEVPNFVPLFPSLATEKLQSDRQFTVTETADSLILKPKTTYPTFSPSPNLSIPSPFATEFLVPVSVRKDKGTLLITPLYPTIRMNGTTLQIPTETLTLRPNLVKNPSKITFVDTNHTFSQTNGPMWTYLLNPYQNTLRLSDGKNEEVLLLDSTRFLKTPLAIPLPWAKIDNVSVSIPKIASPFTHMSLIRRGLYDTKVLADPLPSTLGERKTVIDRTDDGVSFSVVGSKGELSFYLDNLFHQGTYLMTVDAAYTRGLPINFYVDNTYQHRAEVESVLAKDQQQNIIIIPPTEQVFEGYGFHFTVKSVGNETAESTIKEISVYPFPQAFLSQLIFTTGNTFPQSADRQKIPLRFSRMSLSSYETVSLKENALVELSQSFDPGWKAYRVADTNQKGLTTIKRALPFVFGIEVKDHVKVNNWANGWIIGNSPQLVIVYLPQYLQYFGLLITLFSLLWLSFRALRHRHKT